MKENHEVYASKLEGRYLEAYDDVLTCEFGLFEAERSAFLTSFSPSKGNRHRSGAGSLFSLMQKHLFCKNYHITT